MPIDFGRDNERNRQRWLGERLSALPAGQRILDAGAGELRNRRHCAHLEYVSQDFGRYQGRGDGSALQTGTWDTTRIDVVSDICAIPLPDGSFDAVLCTEVLEHVPDPLGALREFGRLLRPGGKLLLTAPFCSLTHFAPYHFATGFSRYWYEHHLSALGFTVTEMAPNGGWFDYLAQELWRLPWSGRKYSSGLLGWCSLAAALPLLALLRLQKRADSGSGELLCFGWHVVAERGPGK